MLSGSTNISVDGGVGVHMAAIALPNGSQGFVGITVSPMPGLAYLDPDNSTQVIYDANGTTTSDSFTFSYIDGMGMTDTYTVNVTITGTGSGSGSGSGASSGSASDSASGSGSGSANSASSGSGSGSGSASGTSSVANTVPTIATLTFMKSIASGGVVDGWCEGTLSDATLSDRYAVQIDTLSAATGDPMETYPSTQTVYNDPADYEFYDPQRYASNYNDQLDNTPLTYTVGGVKIAVGKSHVWARAVEYPSGGGTFVYSTASNGIDFGDWQQFEVTAVRDNTVPEPQNDTASTLHDTAVSGNVASNDNLTPDGNGGWKDSDGNAVTFLKANDPSRGTLTNWNSITGDYTYLPNFHYVGTDSSFTYILTDGIAVSTTWATVKFTVHNSVPEPHDDARFGWGLHDRAFVGNVATNDGLTSDGVGGWKDSEGDPITFVVTSPLAGLYLDATTGGFIYYPASGVAGLGIKLFQYKLSDGLGTSVNAATAGFVIYNSAPGAKDVTFTYPEPGEFIEFDITQLNDNGTEFDSDGDTVQIASVTQPSDGGTATIVGNKIRYTPPSDYNNDDATIDVFTSGTLFNYTLTDNLATSNVGTITAGRRIWTPLREYSRGNDDVGEYIYETGKIKVELEIDEGSQKVFLIYTATSTTASRLRPNPNGTGGITVQPGDLDQGMPEYQFYQANLYLQAYAGVRLDEVPPGRNEVNLTYTAGPTGTGMGSTLTGRLEVGNYNTTAGAGGQAVIQMRTVVTPQRPNALYDYVRQTIAWFVNVESVGGVLKPKIAGLDVAEHQFENRLQTALRIVNSSNTNGLVYKTGYPDKAMQLQRNPASLLDPLNPPADWTTILKVRDK